MSIQHEDVFKAADELAARGETVSVRAVRKELGTGSMATINTHLNSWKRRQEQKNDSSAVDILSAQIKNMISAEISRLLQDAKAENREKITSLETNNSQISDDNIALQAKIDSSKRSEVELKNRITALEATIKMKDEEIGALKTTLKDEQDKSSKLLVEVATEKLKASGYEEFKEKVDRLTSELREAEKTAVAKSTELQMIKNTKKSR